MSQTYFALLTAVGEAKLANAAALGTQLQISRMAVGDGNGNLPVPSRTQTALINEQYRADLNELKVDPNNASQIIAELVIPETEGGYWLREMGLYDASGDLIAVSNCPPSYKPQMAEGSGRTQVLRMMLIVSSTAAVQLKIDPSVVLATRAYADNLIVVHQAASNPHPQYQQRGPVVILSVNTELTEAQLGLVLLNASGGARNFTLPATSAALGVREVVLRRTDITNNALLIAASGTDKIMLDTSEDTSGQSTTELLFAGDYLRLRSDASGKWWCVGQAQLPGNIDSGLVSYTVAGFYTFTVPPVLRSGRRRPKVTLVGGGGSGRSVSGSAASAGGGAAGGQSIKVIGLTGVTSVPVTVGGGGAAVIPPAGSTLPGNPGGTSSFGTYHSATGGAGGTSGSAPGGIGIGGDINTSLGDAQGGQTPTSVSFSALPGAGVGGGSANTPNSTNNADGGTHPGAGGGGCLTTSGVARASGRGADGQVIIEW